MHSNPQGSCLCQAARFEVVGSFESFFLCHCSYCRKDTGSAHAANLFAPSATLKWLTDTQTVRVYPLPNTRHVKSFCTTCGSALPNDHNGFVVVPAGSLDTPVTLTPTAHLFMASRAEWDQDLHTAQQFATFPLPQT
jgi:hypothetical protein